MRLWLAAVAVETRNESWVQTNFRNIKFVNNIHSSGGFFMSARRPRR